MPKLTPQIHRERYLRVLHAWETLAPGHTFGGKTLTEYRKLTDDSENYRHTLDTLDAQVTQAQSGRDDNDNAIHAALEFIVASVKGDPSVGGADGALYEAMGYIPKSERKSGLTRKRKPAPTDTTPA